MIVKNLLILKVKGTKWIQMERQMLLGLDPGSRHGKEVYFAAIPEKHLKSARTWMEDGLFQRVQMLAFAENPTLTGYSLFEESQPYFYCIPTDILPFTGWDYIQVKKFKCTDSLITMYGTYVEHILRMVGRKLHNKQVRFQIVLCYCMDIQQYIEPGTKYDRILTTNLMDYVILPDLLRVCSKLLNRANSLATIVTETQNWTRDFCHKADIVGNHIDDTTSTELSKTGFEDTKNH